MNNSQLPAMPRFRLFALHSVAALAVCVCCVSNAAEDPLPSWNDGPPKRAILEFVVAVTDENRNDYVKPSERIAVFDKSGTAMLYVNGKKVREGRVSHTISGRYNTDIFDVGMDLHAAGGDDYKTPFKLTGTIDSVTIELKE